MIRLSANTWIFYFILKEHPVGTSVTIQKFFSNEHHPILPSVVMLIILLDEEYQSYYKSYDLKIIMIIYTMIKGLEYSNI